MVNNIAKQFFTLRVGDLVCDEDKTYRISHVISVDSILANELQTGESCKLAIETLHLFEEHPSESIKVSDPVEDSDLLDYTPEAWQEAQRRLQAIKGLLGNPLAGTTDVQRTAKVHGVHPATLYRWLAAYTNAGHVSALVPNKPGRKAGTTVIDKTAEVIVQATLEDFFLYKQRFTAQDVVEEVRRRCRLAHVIAPHSSTIRRRVARIPDREKLRRRGRKEEAVNRYTALRGSFPGADYPYAVVQIDHTPADIIVVDETYRKPIGRPYITLAIDVFSRMIAGLYLSLDPPSAASVGLCLAQALCPKREYLAELGVSGSWPVWGRMTTVHCDNAKEFRGIVLERACQEYGIDLAWRPVKVPRYGGHIERMMGTLARQLHKLPGTTFSNPRDRKGYNSMAEASLTLKELERHLIDFIVNIYHQRVHSKIGMSPLRRWENGLTGDATRPGLGLMPLPEDPERIRLDFMPFVERTIQPYGIQIDNVTYYDTVLDPYINATVLDKAKVKQTFLIRRDPRDISKVHFFEPKDKRYCAIPYRNVGHPAMSLYELREVNRRLKDEGRRDIDETLIFDTLNRLRTRVTEAAEKSKAARRQVQRRPDLARETLRAKAAGFGNQKPLTIGHPGEVSDGILFDDDPFAQPVRPFDDLRLKR